MASQREKRGDGDGTLLETIISEPNYYPIYAASQFLLASLLVAIRRLYDLPAAVSWVALCLMLLGFVLSSYWIRSDSRIRDGVEVSADTPLPTNNVDVQLLLTEYEQICEEARYRDRLVVKATYFSLATLAIVATILVNVPAVFRPLVAAIGMMLAFAYAVYTIWFKQTHDRILERQRKIEDHPLARGLLATQRTIYSAENASMFTTLTSRVSEAHFFFFLIWAVAYVILMLHATLA